MRTERGYTDEILSLANGIMFLFNMAKAPPNQAMTALSLVLSSLAAQFDRVISADEVVNSIVAAAKEDLALWRAEQSGGLASAVPPEVAVRLPQKGTA